jgi:hypothetical protein
MANNHKVALVLIFGGMIFHILLSAESGALAPGRLQLNLNLRLLIESFRVRMLCGGGASQDAACGHSQ